MNLAELLEWLSLISMCVGLLACLYFYVQLLIIAFQENLLLGIACVILQVPLLFLVTTRWDRAGGSFLRAAGSGVGGFIMAVLLIIAAEFAR